MIEWIASFLASLLSSWMGRNKLQEEQEHALSESQEDAKAFAAPDRSKSDIISAFRVQRDD